jgi:hypothetical protein
MFSKHTFGARNYGHYQGYREKGDTGPGLTNAWRSAQRAKRRRAAAFRATRETIKSQRQLTKIQATLSERGGGRSGTAGISVRSIFCEHD